MVYSEAQKRATDKYNKKTYENVTLRVKRGDKAIIQNYAAKNNETVNGLINRLLKNEIPELRDK